MTPQSAASAPHPQLPCTRCGAFIASPAELTLLDGKPYCATCAARPDVNYLETFRLKYWGKRDGWAWLIGFGSLVSLLTVAQFLAAGEAASALGALVGAVVNFCFFLGLRWARYAFLVTLLLRAALAAATAPEETRSFVLGTFLLPVVIALAVFNDTRNQLFFKVEVPRAKLQKAWDLYMNNTAARAGVMLAVSGVLIPPFAPLALILSIVGLRNVDPHSTPPIGRKGQAIAGIVISSLSVLAWGGVLIAAVMSRAAQ